MQRTALRAIAVAVVALVTAAPAQALGPGTVDTAFGTDRSVVPGLLLPRDDEPAVPLATTADGGFVVGGASARPVDHPAFGVERFGPRGALVGRAVVFADGSGARSLALLPGGGVVTAGTGPLPDGRTGLAAVAFDAAGEQRWTSLQPPPAGADAWVTVDGAARSDDGTVVLSGTVLAGGRRELAVAKLAEADGQPDAGFGGGVLVDTRRGTCDGQGDVGPTRVVGSGAGAVVAAVSYTGCGQFGLPERTELRRYTRGGDHDADVVVGTEGRVTGLAQGVDGSIYLAASAMSLTRYDPALRPVPGFDASWLRGLAPDRAPRLTALALQPDGRALVTRVVDESSLIVIQRAEVDRLLPDGRRDRSFHPADLSLARMGEATSLAVATDGGVLVGGRFGDGGPPDRVKVARVYGGSATSTAGARGPAVRRGTTIRLRLRCAGNRLAPGCGGLLRLRTLSGRSVGHATYEARIDTTRTVTVHLGGKGRSALHRATRRALRATVTNGPGQTRRRALRLVVR